MTKIMFRICFCFFVVMFLIATSAEADPYLYVRTQAIIGNGFEIGSKVEDTDEDYSTLPGTKLRHPLPPVTALGVQAPVHGPNTESWYFCNECRRSLEWRL